MLKNSIVLPGLAAIALCLIACSGNNSGIRKNGVFSVAKDSCVVTLSMRRQQGTATSGTVAGTNDSLIEMTVSFETSRKMDSTKNGVSDPLIFGMDSSFNLCTGNQNLLPVFCQPIATGSKSKFIYWVSFEVNPSFIKNKPSQLLIVPNRIVRDSILFQL